jgi:hypothetical protein
MQVALVLAALTLQAPSPSTVRPAVPIRDWLLGAPAGLDAADEGPPRAVPEWRPISITPDTVLMLDLRFSLRFSLSISFSLSIPSFLLDIFRFRGSSANIMP